MASPTEALLAEILRTLEKQERKDASGGLGDKTLSKFEGLAGSKASRETSALVRGRGALGNIAAGRALGGGLRGAAAAGALGIAGAAAAGGIALAGAGAVEASQGGTFGGGAARAALAGAAKIPILGELTGAAPAARIAQGVQGDLNAVTNQVARFAGAGAVTPRARQFLARTLTEQNKNVEADRQANKAATSAELSNITSGQGAVPELISSLGQLTDTIGRLLGSAGGASHRT